VRRLLALLTVSCAPAAFQNEKFFCDDTHPCAGGYRCLGNTCSLPDAGDCGGPDRGDCASHAFCDSLQRCDSDCTASRFNDFTTAKDELNGGVLALDGGLVLEAIDAGVSFFSPVTSKFSDGQPLASCGFSFKVSSFPQLPADQGWQVMLRYQSDNDTWVGFKFERQEVSYAVVLDGGTLGARNLPLAALQRFAMRPSGHTLHFYAAEATGSWTELGTTEVGELPKMGLVMWLACFGNATACPAHASRRLNLASYNIEFPTAPP
jgi:hypothetical protein